MYYHLKNDKWSLLDCLLTKEITIYMSKSISALNFFSLILMCSKGLTRSFGFYNIKKKTKQNAAFSYSKFDIFYYRIELVKLSQSSTCLPL